MVNKKSDSIGLKKGEAHCTMKKRKKKCFGGAHGEMTTERQG